MKNQPGYICADIKWRLKDQMKTEKNSIKPEYPVSILSNNKGDTITGIFIFKEDFPNRNKKEFSIVIYFEKFFERDKAIRRKCYLNKLDNE